MDNQFVRATRFPRVIYSSLTCDWDSTEPKPRFDIQYFFDDMVWRKNNWIRDEPVLVTLHGSDHSRLRLGRLIMMDNTYPTQELPRSDE
jgi:hypothetical protein